MDTNKLQLFLALGLTIFSIVNGQGCSWMNASNTISPGGVGQNSINDLPTCQSMCSMNMSTTCKYGFDWDQNNPTTKCWFSTSSQTSPSTGVCHYVWGGGSNCNAAGSGGGSSGATTAATITTGALTSTTSTKAACLWSGRVADSHTTGGIPQPQITTAADCQYACLADANCPKNGIDWDPSETPNCYFCTSTKLSYAKGVSHYTVANPDTCGGITQLRSDCYWNVSTYTGTDGGALTSYKYLVACQTACYLTNGTLQANGNMGTGNCIGVDWNTATSTCYFTTRWATFRYNNVNHYTLVCSGNIITSTETTMTATSTSSRVSDPSFSASPASTVTSTGDPTGMLVGIGVGIGVGGCVIVAIISLCLYMKCRRSKHKNGVGVTAPEQPPEFTNRLASTTQNSFTKGTLNGAGHYEGLNSARDPPQGTYDELNVTTEYETMDAGGSQEKAIYDEINDKQYEKLDSGISVNENMYDRMNAEGLYDRSLDLTDSGS